MAYTCGNELFTEVRKSQSILRNRLRKLSFILFALLVIRYLDF